MPQSHVDLRCGCIVGGIRGISSTELILADTKAEFAKEIERLTSYMWKSTKHRIKLIRTGEIPNIRCAVAGEMAFSAGGRPDLVENLFERLGKIESLKSEIEALEQVDYEHRFGLQKT